MQNRQASAVVDNLLATLRQRCFRRVDDVVRGENDVAVRYVMDGNDAYLYPNVLLAASLFREPAAGTDALYPKRADERDDVEQLTTLSLSSLNALGRLSRDMQVQLEAARARGDVNTARQIERSIGTARQVLIRSSNRFPHLTSLLPAIGDSLAAPLPVLPPIEDDARPGLLYRDVHYAGMWRDNLLSQIQAMCAHMGNYEIVKGTNASRSAARRNFESIDHWRDACHRRDQRYQSAQQSDTAYLTSEQVIDDITENIHVFSGKGRLVRKKQSNRVEYGTDDEQQITRLFLAFPGCFSYKRFPLDTAESSIERYADRHPNRTVYATLRLPTLVARTNQVLAPGIYRLDRTIFLTLRDEDERTIAVRSDYREADGRLRFAEKHYDRPNFESGDTPPARTYHAGNANLFMALKRDSDKHLLGFWIGCIMKNSNIGHNEYPIVYNSHVGKLPDCRVRHAGAAREQIVVRKVSANQVIYRGRRLPAHNVVRLVLSSDALHGQPKRGEIRNGLLVDFLCAAQPGARCPPNLPPIDAEFEGVAGVGIFLFYYALVYYSKYSPSSLNLYVRRWTTRSKKKRTKGQLFAEATVARFYNKNFGLQFVPVKSAMAHGNHLHSKQEVRQQIEDEIGLTYMRSEYPRVFESASPIQLNSLLEQHPEFCHFAILLRDVRNADGTVDLGKLGESPLFESNFNWPQDAATERRNSREKVRSVGRMFRYYPHLAELEMRIVENFLSLSARLEQRGAADVDEKLFESIRYRYQNTLVPANDSLQRFAATVEERAKQEFLLSNPAHTLDQWNNADAKDDDDDEQHQAEARRLRTKHANEMIANERNRPSTISWDDSIDELVSESRDVTQRQRDEMEEDIVPQAEQEDDDDDVDDDDKSPPPPTPPSTQRQTRPMRPMRRAALTLDNLLSNVRIVSDLRKCGTDSGLALHMDDVLGRGASSVVVAAGTDRQFAAKIALFDSDETKQRFSQEGWMHQKMYQAGITTRPRKAFGCTTAGLDFGILIMDRWPTTLDKVDLTPLQTARVANKLQEYAAKMRAMGVVHADIRPANIALQMNETNTAPTAVVLLDWGLAFQPDKYRPQELRQRIEFSRRAHQMTRAEKTPTAYDIDTVMIKRLG